MNELAHLVTPSEGRWIEREHESNLGDDPRSPFDRDRDRILHSRAFRRLQHKTQVFIVTEGDDYRTRITHSLEVAQIGRSLARLLGLSESLAEAIALGHDVGHTPFGHVGEATMNRLLSEEGGWNSNAHSLLVLGVLEIQYPEHPGLNLTWATREGIARHKTPFDVPVEGFSEFLSPSLECQCVNVADPLAYVTHDLHDALDYGLVTPEDLDATGSPLWKYAWGIARARFEYSHPGGRWPGVDSQTVMYRDVHRQLIDTLMRDVLKHSIETGHAIPTLEDARAVENPIVTFSQKTQGRVDLLLKYMYEEVYKSPLVSRQNFKSERVLEDLFRALIEKPKLLPRYIQEQVEGVDIGAKRIHVAHYLAGLSDRAALDLYAELFEPRERAMGRHVR